jgi:alkaline phosphatase D
MLRPPDAVNRVRRRLLESALALPLLGSRAAFAASPGYPRLMQGPMVGSVTPTSLTIWGRASGGQRVSVEYSSRRDFSSTRETEAVLARAEDDFTVRIVVPDLTPGTRYWYRVRVEGQVDRYKTLPFATWTAPAEPRPFRVAFGSCSRVQVDPVQRIFEAVRLAEPDLFLWLGDHVYGDTLEPKVLAEEYRRQRNVAALEPLLAAVPQLAVWDDHDFGVNNGDRTSPMREASLGVFRDYWANPGFGVEGAPGVFFRYSYAGVDFFFLDGRYYRDPNVGTDGPGKTLLGAAQKAWLEAELAASRAPFKLLVSGSGWSSGDGPKGDTWSAFLHERNALFDFIRDRRIGGVVLLSGDTHAGELNCMQWSERGGYDFYDLSSSPLAQLPTATWMDLVPEHRIRPVYARGTNFGVLDFAWEPEPTVTFTLRDDRGVAVWTPLTLGASELENGRSTWREKTTSA